MSVSAERGIDSNQGNISGLLLGRTVQFPKREGILLNSEAVLDTKW